MLGPDVADITTILCPTVRNGPVGYDVLDQVIVRPKHIEMLASEASAAWGGRAGGVS